MLKKSLVVAGPLALVLIGAAIAQQPGAPQPLVLRIISVATDINKFRNSPSGMTTGDLYVWSDNLFPAPARGITSGTTPEIPIEAKIGTADGRCILIAPSPPRFDCSITGKLHDGDVMNAGTLTLVPGSTSILAVVGGTGAYRNARGEVTVKLGPPQGPHELTLTLILNP